MKTRLNDRLGPANALRMYCAFVFDMLDMLSETGADTRIYFDPPDKKKNLEEFLDKRKGKPRSLFPQEGKNLGEKMSNALSHAFASGYEKAVLIGSDLPDLPADTIETAFAALDEYPAVIGPSEDGGYYLIGFRSDGYLPEVFVDIAWSTGHVLEQTIEKFRRFACLPEFLPEWRDVDTGGDLEALADRIGKIPGRIRHTRKVMEECGLMGGSDPDAQ